MIDHSERVRVVEKLCKSLNSKNWARELRTLKDLEEKGFVDYDFWINLKLDYNFYSLSHLYGNNCGLLQKEYLKYLKKKQAEEIFDFSVKHRL